MQHYFSILALIALSGFLSACSCDASDSSLVRTQASLDLRDFAKYVNLPEKPLTTTFQTLNRAKPSRTPGPSDWYLFAVVTFEPAALKRLQSRSKETDPVVLDGKEVRPWFPKNVTALLTRFDNQSYRFPGPAYRALSFVKPPLNDGEFTGLDRTSFFLAMDCCGPITMEALGK